MYSILGSANRATEKPENPLVFVDCHCSIGTRNMAVQNNDPTQYSAACRFEQSLALPVLIVSSTAIGFVLGSLTTASMIRSRAKRAELKFKTGEAAFPPCRFQNRLGPTARACSKSMRASQEAAGLRTRKPTAALKTLFRRCERLGHLAAFLSGHQLRVALPPGRSEAEPNEPSRPCGAGHAIMLQLGRHILVSPIVLGRATPRVAV